MTDKEIAMAFMNALWTGDLDAVDRLTAADATWVFQLGMPQAQEPRGRIWPLREALARIIADLFGKFDPDGFSVTVSRTIAENGSVAIEYEANGRTADGKPYQNFYCSVLTVREGKVIELRPYNDTRHMLERLANV
jgi:uncharacterized protein